MSNSPHPNTLHMNDDIIFGHVTSLPATAAAGRKDVRQTVHVAVHLTTFVTGECASLRILAFLVSRCISTWLAVDEEQSGKTQAGKI